jgi:hypothetical protein
MQMEEFPLFKKLFDVLLACQMPILDSNYEL